MSKKEKKYPIPKIVNDFIKDECFTDWDTKGTYKVYQFVDLTNSKVFYVGCTSQPLKVRFKQHILMSITHHSILEKLNEISKYPMLTTLKEFIDSNIKIKVSVLFEFDSKEKALEVEAMVIYLSCLNKGMAYSLNNIKNSQTVNYKSL